MQPPRNICNPRVFADHPSPPVGGSGLRTGAHRLAGSKAALRLWGSAYPLHPLRESSPVRARGFPSFGRSGCVPEPLSDWLLFAADQPVIAAAPSPLATRMTFGLPQAIGPALSLPRCPGFGLRCATAAAAGPRRTLPVCCNDRVTAAVVPWAPRSIWLCWVVDSPQPFSSPCFFAGFV